MRWIWKFSLRLMQSFEFSFKAIWSWFMLNSIEIHSDRESQWFQTRLYVFVCVVHLSKHLFNLLEWKTFYASKYEQAQLIRTNRWKEIDGGTKREHQSEIRHFIRPNCNSCVFICAAHLQICHQECEMNVDSCRTPYFIRLKARNFCMQIVAGSKTLQFNSSNSFRLKKSILCVLFHEIAAGLCDGIFFTHF